MLLQQLQEITIEEQNTHHWDWKLWIWALLCTAGILLTVPIARNIQKFIYSSIGKVHITYAILFLIFSAFLALLCFLIFKMKTRYLAQYLWLFATCGIYGYFTLRLRKYPEEAAHFIEYGLLSFFIFKALAHRIKDWTVYVSTILCVTVVGIVDEFIQWMLPSRIWDYKDIGLNTLSAGLFILLIWKVIRPGKICRPVQRISVKMLSGIIILTVILLGLCLSNTPEIVSLYTAHFSALQWLQTEEVMTGNGTVQISLRGMWLLIASLLVLVRTVRKRWERRLEN